jgi:hypothetical protein
MGWRDKWSKKIKQKVTMTILTRLYQCAFRRSDFGDEEARFALGDA